MYVVHRNASSIAFQRGHVMASEKFFMFDENSKGCLYSSISTLDEMMAPMKMGMVKSFKVVFFIHGISLASTNSPVRHFGYASPTIKTLPVHILQTQNTPLKVRFRTFAYATAFMLTCSN